MAGEGSVFRRVRVRRSGDRAAVRDALPAAGGGRASWELVCAAGAAGRAGRASAPDPARRLPSRKVALEVLGRLRNPEAGETGGILTVGDWLVSRTSPAASTVRGYAAHVCLYLGPR